ncbi:MAG: VWA domain-containing protein [Candidatus Sumerlaeota bacterium]|nr:VWA domain-containing protein [Candidatus Sumerlaeota bacterium]
MRVATAIWAFMLAGGLLQGVPGQGLLDARHEVVLLLDGSEAWRQADPKSSGARAVQMFVQLLPPGARVAVVRFADEPATVFPLQAIDNDPARQALASALGSAQSGPGIDLSTGMELALKSFSGGAQVQRDIVVLTRGSLEADGDTQAKEDNRRRLRAVLVPRCQAARVRLNVVTLPEGADQTVLCEAAEATGGLAFVCDTPKRLHEFLLPIVEILTPAQRLLLRNRSVTVDSWVREATFVMTRPPFAQPLLLQPPVGNCLSAASASQSPGVQWFSSLDYDVVTVRDPTPGVWAISPPAGSHDRVFVDTDLALTVEAQRRVGPGEPLMARARLQTLTGAAVDEPLLSSMVVSARFLDSDNAPLAELKRVEEGVFESQLQAPETLGVTTLVVRAVGQSLKRTAWRNVVVERPAATATLEEREGAPGQPIIVNARIDAPERFRRLDLAATVVNPRGEAVELSIPPAASTLYANAFAATTEPGRYTISVRVEGEATDGKPVEECLPALEYSAGEAVVASATPEGAATSTASESPDAGPQGNPRSRMREALTDHGFLVGFVMANLLLCVGGVALWRFLWSVAWWRTSLERRLAVAARQALGRLKAASGEASDPLAAALPNETDAPAASAPSSPLEDEGAEGPGPQGAGEPRGKPDPVAKDEQAEGADQSAAPAETPEGLDLTAKELEASALAAVKKEKGSR